MIKILSQTVVSHHSITLLPRGNLREKEYIKKGLKEIQKEVEKEDNTREEDEGILFANFQGLCPHVYSALASWRHTWYTWIHSRAYTFPISRPPKYPGSLPHSYWQPTSLDSSGLYFLQSLPPNLVFHLEDLILPSISCWSNSSHSDSCRHFGKPGIFYSQSLISQMPHCCHGYHLAPQMPHPSWNCFLTFPLNATSEARTLWVSCLDPYLTIRTLLRMHAQIYESLCLSGVGKTRWLADKI